MPREMGKGSERAESLMVPSVWALRICSLRRCLGPRTCFSFLPAHPFLLQGKPWPG